MSLENFLKFYKDYEVFPSLIAVNKMNEIYNTLLEIMKKNPENKKYSYIGIDENLFNQSIVLIAHFSKTNSTNQK